ncbi:type II toxin-antitoxin system RelE/ParE family toxin [Tunicatimonas pelagia]|uniref:type II toxin-antitoxin system RelE/ParE family toxin n=1 Tax=Tunicatimonas pelagia TaxID=931531 RepID=UPI002665F222|nr:type II toxin-antitoxin system RelE/ParE family toxin [Tunicatimonas pelagia]WKN40742.1 type II toxin-antitoxin system RelE/ParE family toxin [Tunicatimonas pelagia]
MNREIVWSPLAQQDVEQQLDYLTREWRMQVGIDLLERIDEVLAAITSDPTTYYQVDASRQIHKFMVNKYTVLYYQVTTEAIRLITFWDGRQDEKKLTERLKNS